jgi:hypothetical protein
MNPDIKEKPKEKTKDTLSNKDKLELEKENMEEALQNPNTDQFLYPSLDDPNFNIKINNKKEFSNAKYDGTIANVEDRADELSKVDYELLPQQAFVKNFMSFQTPYNSLLLFHGLGSGKTCSAIGVCEEMRDYLRQMGISKQIIIVASPNVQDNFKLQLFDERKLKEQDGIWTTKGCLGNKLLKEINPTGMKGLKRDKVIQLVKNIINSSYYFVGYTQFSNDIVRNQGINVSDDMKRRNLENEYGGSLIVIDEVHNIRISDDNENKNVAKNLMYLVSVVNNMRLLLLSATPMFNSYKEIVWLLNLMNMNDRRGIVGVSDIFDAKTGELTEDGRKLLIRKATGYVSYVRGENPYTFPFRVYPNKFAPKDTIQSIKEYPEYSLNGNVINDNKKISKLQLFVTHIGRVQEMGYRYIMNNLRMREARIRTTKTGQERLMPGFKEMKSFGYTDLMLPLQALNIIYPHDNLEELVAEIEPIVYEKRLAEKEEEIDDISPLKTDTGDVIDEIDDVLLNGPEASVSTEPKAKAEQKVEQKAEPKAKALAKAMKTRKVKQPILEEIIVKPRPKAKSRKAKSEVKEEGIHIIEGDTMSREQTLKNTNIPSEENLDLELDELEDLEDLEELKGGARGRPKKVITGLEVAEKPLANAINPGNINPKELTGSEGLRSLMNYEDSRTPAIKGSFEYKPGKTHIFEPGKIIEYSSKIANVCEYIYNTNTKRLSDGIILIYSSYIDAGLIPMALALEEMGFTRHNGKSLFKTAPKNKVIKSAKYIMITGDPRLSPNNDADLKSITNDDNINGDKIKVVLISQAGSEGLDFKAIRQIHILDPWYNVNRLEQIIGRGVRNFSHKDLPFRKRNVQIFLYGTWLTNTEEEAVDLYVYRISEIKAIKIGKVTRLLKQVSVDCLINHDQSLLTADELKDSNPNVEQLLSDHTLLKKFEVGDLPGSATCDYGECEYTCLPLKDKKEEGEGEEGEEGLQEEEASEKVVDGPFNLNTYNETFMLVNSEKIIQKIKALFSDPIDGRFFYKKKTLMMFIKQQKAYPTDQIYSALTYLINDNSAFITDKYGRTGHLINIGDYYLFQPSELNYPNISVFDRSVPLNYKNDKIKFDINPNVINPNVLNPNVINQNVLDVSSPLSLSPLPSISLDPGKAVLDAMYKNYITTKTVTSADKGSDDWYQHCGIVLQDMCRKQTSLITSKRERLKVFKSLIDTFLDKFVVQHIVDSIRFQERIDLMNYLISDLEKRQEQQQDKEKEDFINLIRKYLKTKEYYAERSKLTYVVLFDGPSKQYKDITDEKGKSNGNLNIFILRAKKWVPAEPEDKRDLEQPIIDNYKLSKEVKSQMNDNVGFIGFETNHKDMVFKIKDTTNSRSYGYRCIQAGKGKKIIDTLEELESVNPLLARSDTDAKDSVFELCIRIELLLRIYQEEKIEGKMWFIDTERAIFNQFEKKEKEKE